jgi:hypothetical protein
MFALNAVLNSDYDAVQRSSSQTWEESRKRRPTWSAMFNVAEQYGTPVRVTLGTNVVIGQEGNRLSSELGRIVAGRAKKGTIPPLWDGHAGERIADVLQSLSI